MSTTKLPKLDGTNYRSWAEMVRIVLELRGTKQAITSAAVEPLIDLQAELIVLE